MNQKHQTKLSIGIFSASSDLGSKYRHRVIGAQKFFENKDVTIDLGNLAFNSNGYCSGSIKERAKEFNELMIHNPVLMSMIGGMNSSSILEYIDYDGLLRKQTKVVGYSDTTAILLAIYAKTQLPVYYGPAFLPCFFEQSYIRDKNFDNFMNYVINNQVGPVKNPSKWTEQRIDWSNKEIQEKVLNRNELISFNDGIVTGRIIGGNLSTIIPIYHTEYMPKIKKGDILFFEDSMISIDECERNFAFLKNNKILELVSGIVIGKCEAFNSMNSQETYVSLFMRFLDRKIPVLANYDCGHTMPMNIIKIGSTVELNTFKKQITIIDQALATQTKAH